MFSVYLYIFLMPYFYQLFLQFWTGVDLNSSEKMALYTGTLKESQAGITADSPYMGLSDVNVRGIFF